MVDRITSPSAYISVLSRFILKKKFWRFSCLRNFVCATFLERKKILFELWLANKKKFKHETLTRLDGCAIESSRSLKNSSCCNQESFQNLERNTLKDVNHFSFISTRLYVDFSDTLWILFFFFSSHTCRFFTKEYFSLLNHIFTPTSLSFPSSITHFQSRTT